MGILNNQEEQIIQKNSSGKVYLLIGIGFDCCPHVQGNNANRIHPFRYRWIGSGASKHINRESMESLDWN